MIINPKETTQTSTSKTALGRSPHMDFGQYNLMTVPSNSRWITRSQFNYLSLDVRLWKWHGG